MSDQIFRHIVVALLAMLVGSTFVNGGTLGTINGTVEYLAMKARQQSAAR